MRRGGKDRPLTGSRSFRVDTLVTAALAIMVAVALWVREGWNATATTAIVVVDLGVEIALIFSLLSFTKRIANDRRAAGQWKSTAFLLGATLAFHMLAPASLFVVTKYAVVMGGLIFVLATFMKR